MNNFAFSSLKEKMSRGLNLPIFTESTNSSNNKWVDYGVNNNFPEQLIYLYNNCGMNKAIIDSKTNMIVGSGIQVVDDEIPSPETKRFINRPNKYESLDNILYKLAYDYELFGLSYINVKWRLDGLGISEMYHMDASKIRWGILNLQNQLDYLYFSKNWGNLSLEQNKPVPIPIFDSNNPGDSQIIPIVKYTPGVDYYTYPSYSGGLRWISLNSEISKYHWNNLEGGFTPTILFDFPLGASTPEERDKVVEQVKKEYEGIGRNKALFVFSDPDSNGVNVEILEISDIDKHYDILNQTAKQEILISHRVTSPSLVGIETPGKLGSSSDILVNHELFYKTVIKNDQDIIMKHLNDIFLLNGMNEIEVNRNKPIDVTFSENIMEKILTVNEMREILGYDEKKIDEKKIEEEPDEETSSLNHKLEYNDYKCCDDHNCDHHIYLDYKGDDNYIDFDESKHKLSKDVKLLSNKEVLDYPNDNDFFLWKLGTGGKAKKNCPSCLKLSGQLRTLSSWRKIAIPTIKDSGNPKKYKSPYGSGKYGTFCTKDCTCELILID